MAEEPFQKGVMFWRQDNDQIYALFNGGSWGAYANTWREGDAEETCSSGTPVTPCAVGKVWCRSGVRAALERHAPEGIREVQDFQRGPVIRTDAVRRMPCIKVMDGEEVTEGHGDGGSGDEETG
jgi:hypothetical protein